MKRITVVRCPKCGSTNAASDESRSIVDITCMQCRACGFYAFVDDNQLKDEWNVDILLSNDAATIPPYVEPLRDRD